jgi:hypothetical protein
MSNVKNFKKFSELNKTKTSNSKEVIDNTISDSELDKKNKPNLPKETSKTESPSSYKKEEKNDNIKEEVKFYGKVAKFPNKVKASKALNFLENVKISKNSIWYIIVEKQDNELQMVKYNNKQGFDLHSFVLELKGYYIKKYMKENPKIVPLIESIKVDGKNEFSYIRNIPPIEVEGGYKLIAKITEDLIRLLSK